MSESTPATTGPIGPTEPTEPTETRIVKSETQPNNALAVVRVGQNGAIITQAQDWRRPRDSFELLVDPELSACITRVAATLESLRFFRVGKNRYNVILRHQFRGAWQRAIEELGAEDFNLDMWYHDMLPAEAHSMGDPKIANLALMCIENKEMNADERAIDWTGELQRLEQKWPGIVRVLWSILQQEKIYAQTLREQKQAGVAYHTETEMHQSPLGRVGDHMVRRPLQSQKSRSGARMLKNRF